MYWFTADTHFSHRRIIELCNRPFSSIDEMNDVIIDNINAKVLPGDTLFHLGDWSFGKDKKTNDAQIYLDRINCKNIIIIPGNHDPHYENMMPRKEFAELFAGCYPLYRLKTKLDDKRIEVFMFHYSCRVWNKSHYGAWHLWAHSHYSLFDDSNALSIDVGMDAVAGRATGLTHKELMETRAWNLLSQDQYRPICLNEIAALMSQKTFSPVDHHR